MNTHMRIDVTSGDDPEFIASVDALLAALLTRHRPAKLYLIRVDGWFGGKWLRFSGKMLGALGVARTQLTLPPFVPARIVSQHVLEPPDYSPARNDDPIHRDQPSSDNLRRSAAELFPDCSFLWFAGDSTRNLRGSTMVYLATGSDYWIWYAGWKFKGGWVPADLRGISRAEVEQLARHPPG